MKVLHVYSGNLWGGIESLLVTFARQRTLAPQIVPAFALCYDGKLAHELRDACAELSCLPEVRTRRPWSVVRARHQLRSLVAQSQPRVAICHGCWSHAIFASTIRRSGVPLVFWNHDIPSGRHWTERWATRTSPDLVIANSKFTSTAAHRLFPDAPWRVIHCPVPAPKTAVTETERTQIRQSLGASTDTVVIVTACRMEPWKGHRLLLDALAELGDSQELPEWSCWIAGGCQRDAEREYNSELKDRVRQLGLSARVQFLGHRDDVPHLLAAADIHCQPNVASEPFGIAFVEALYAGLPVVTTDMGGGAEIVHDGCGRLVAPDRGRLSDTLRSLIRDAELRRRLGSQAVRRARELSDPATQLAKLESTLDELLQTQISAA